MGPRYLAILSTLIGILLGLFSDRLASDESPWSPWFKKLDPNVAYIVAVLAGIYVVLEIYKNAASKARPPDPFTPEDREWLLSQVEQYSKSNLEAKLSGLPTEDAKLNLELQRRLRPQIRSEHLLYDSKPISKDHPEDPPIYTAFIESKRSLLLVGYPGAGKTVLLLELTQTLIEKAQKTDSEPIPLVLSLSSWDHHYASFEYWLEEALVLRYYNRERIQRLLRTTRFTLILDGLDDVTTRREWLIKGIKEYCAGRIGLAVTSRFQPGDDLGGLLGVKDTVVVLPMEDHGITEYLEKCGPRLLGLRTAMQTSQVLRDALTTPLALSVATTAFRDLPHDELVSLENREAVSNKLWENYIPAMLKRTLNLTSPARPRDYSDEQATRWLTWIAASMKERRLTDFYLEEITPLWLPKTLMRAYRRTASRVAGIAAAIPVFVAFALLQGGSLLTTIALVGATIAGTVVARNSYYRTYFRWQTLQPIELVGWSWKSFAWSSFTSSLQAVTANFMFAMALSFFTVGVVDLGWAMSVGLVYGSAGGLRDAFEKSWKEEPLNFQNLKRPYQGIVNTWRYYFLSWTIGLAIGLVVILLAALSGFRFLAALPQNGGEYISQPFEILIITTAILLFFVAINTKGGPILIAHFSLRRVLAKSQVIPSDLPGFLEDMSRALLMHRVGGAYQFWHQELRDHLAEKLNLYLPDPKLAPPPMYQFGDYPPKELPSMFAFRQTK